MAESTNALTHFLKSDQLVFGPDQYVRLKVFVSAFNDHCKENNLGSVRWTKDYALGPFSMFGLKFSNECRRRYPNITGARTYHGTFILGVDLANELESEQPDDL